MESPFGSSRRTSKDSKQCNPSRKSSWVPFRRYQSSSNNAEPEPQTAITGTGPIGRPILPSSQWDGPFVDYQGSEYPEPSFRSIPVYSSPSLPAETAADSLWLQGLTSLKSVHDPSRSLLAVDAGIGAHRPDVPPMLAVRGQSAPPLCPMFTDAPVDASEFFMEPSLDEKYRSVAILQPPAPLSRDPPGGCGGGMDLLPWPARGQSAPPLMSGGAAMKEHALVKHHSSPGRDVPVCPQPVPKFPYMLVPSWHFSVCLPTDAIVACVSETLRNEVDCEFLPAKCQWKCVRYCPGRMCEIWITVFRDTADSTQQKHVVEFWCRTGCRFESRSLYMVTQQRLQALQSLEPPSQRSASLPPPGAKPGVQLGGAGTPPPVAQPGDANRGGLSFGGGGRLDVAPLLAMLCDSCEDTNYEGCCAVANLSSKPENHEALATADIIRALAALIIDRPKSKLMMHARCFAVFALSNLSEHHAGQKHIMGAGVLPRLVRLLLSECPYAKLELRRECARVVANLSEAFALEIRETMEVEANQWASSLDGLKDDRLQAQASRIRSSLNEGSPEEAVSGITAF